MWVTVDARTSLFISTLPQQMPLIIKILVISPMLYMTSFEGPDLGGWERCVGLVIRGGGSGSPFRMRLA